MVKVSREKIALAVFLLLIVVTVVLLLAYFTAARTWNAVASYVDDTVGATENYTVIAYAGVIPPLPEEGVVNTDAVHVPVSGGSESTEGDESSGVLDALPTASESFNSISVMDDSPDSVDSVSSDNVDDDEVRSSFLSTTGEIITPIWVSDVRNSYELQGSDVLTLNLSQIQTYLAPTVFRMKNHTVGVFSVNAYATRPALEAIHTNLKDRGADVIVCLTPRTAMLADRSYADVVIVTTDEEGVNTIGSYDGNTFTVKSPVQETIGVITLSSSNMVFAKVVDHL